MRYANTAASDYIRENYELGGKLYVEFVIQPAQSEISLFHLVNSGYVNVYNGTELVTADTISIGSAHGDTLRWQSNIPGVEVEVYVGSPTRVDVDELRFSTKGTYNLMFKIPETQNYSGQTRYLTVVVTRHSPSYYPNLPAPKVV